jgi:hypothetical protein
MNKIFTTTTYNLIRRLNNTYLQKEIHTLTITVQNNWILFIKLSTINIIVIQLNL